MPETQVSASGSAPGSIGNVGPGLDVLGLALSGPRDEVHLTWRADSQDVVTDPGHPDLPTDATRNTASVAARSVLDRLNIARGVNISITKGLPLAGGQGGSAASAVAGAVAANHLAGGELSPEALLECALDGEAIASGRQADNLAPSLLGGLVLIRTVDPLDVIRLPVPRGLHLVLVHPDQRLETRLARGILPADVPRHIAIRQSAHVAAMVAGACLDDLRLFGRGIEDGIAEPVRAALLPGFPAAKVAARAAGALGCSISGAGPTVFAVAGDHDAAVRVMSAMVLPCRRRGRSMPGGVQMSVRTRSARVINAPNRRARMEETTVCTSGSSGIGVRRVYAVAV
jgi:homoserine kinase